MHQNLNKVKSSTSFFGLNKVDFRKLDNQNEVLFKRMEHYGVLCLEKIKCILLLKNENRNEILGFPPGRNYDYDETD